MDLQSCSQCDYNSRCSTVQGGVSTSIADIDKPIWNVRFAWHETLFLWILHHGAVPRHVAVVGDGNRRYAKRYGVLLESAYVIMCEKYAQMCQFMVAVGVKDITSYVFSTRNFLRDTEEAGAVLSGAAKFFKTTLQNLDSLKQMSISIRNAGDVDRLPRDLQSSMAQAEIRHF
ncbi:hypothetical protein MTO96_036643 [Rhipicephalus appendiculatus]